MQYYDPKYCFQVNWISISVSIFQHCRRIKSHKCSDGLYIWEFDTTTIEIIVLFISKNLRLIMTDITFKKKMWSEF